MRIRSSLAKSSRFILVVVIVFGVLFVLLLVDFVRILGDSASPPSLALL
jgi:hypothetical protein